MRKKSGANPPGASTRFRELTALEARWRLNGHEKIGPSTVGMTPTEGIIGQERAIKALRLGLELYSPGFNVFVCGITGTGRTSTVQRLLAGIQPRCALPDDIAYVHNFDEPERPIVLVLPRGKAQEIREAVQKSARAMRDDITALVNSEDTLRARRQIEDRHAGKADAVTRSIESLMTEGGLTLAEDPETGSRSLVVTIGEKTIGLDELDEAVAEGVITAEDATHIRAKGAETERMIEDSSLSRQKIQQECRTAVEAFERDGAKPIVAAFVKGLRALVPGENAERWIVMVERAILESLELFRKSTNRGEQAQDRQEGDGPDLLFFDLNVLLTAKDGGCPTVVENHPTHQNLFGSQDRFQLTPGVYGTDFSRIKAGSLLRAQGGYLIVSAIDVLAEPNVWNQLKRTLRSRELVIQPPEQQMGAGMPVLTPEPIPLNVKVIMLGTAALYDALHEGDPDFSEIFKLKADFDSTVDLTPDVLRTYVGVLVRIIREDGLADLDRGALEEILQYSMRLAERQGKLTIRFSPIADILREANYHAKEAGSDLMRAEHVATAVHDFWERFSLVEEKLREELKDGTLRVATDGAVVGQINGLTVLSVGEYSFGMPARITCTTAVGRAGIIDIERECDLGGSTHSKGVHILTGFLTGRYAEKHPLTLIAHLCFEQSFGMVDGDSASAAETLALLSSLAKLPLRQDLAITGALDQFGAVQPIGGINEKIEGFFRTCKRRGLTGTQGVCLPQMNCRELMLAGEVINAIREGQFHLYPVDDIDGAVEIFTGVPAGKIGQGGRYPSGSVNARVAARIEELFRLAKKSK